MSGVMMWLSLSVSMSASQLLGGTRPGRRCGEDARDMNAPQARGTRQPRSAALRLTLEAGCTICYA